MPQQIFRNKLSYLKNAWKFFSNILHADTSLPLKNSTGVVWGTVQNGAKLSWYKTVLNIMCLCN